MLGLGGLGCQVEKLQHRGSTERRGYCVQVSEKAQLAHPEKPGGRGYGVQLDQGDIFLASLCRHLVGE